MDEIPEGEDWEFDSEFDSPDVPFEMMAEFLSTFISAAAQAETMYRRHYCEIVANKIYEKFGGEGMCEMLIALDRKSEWMSDILFESPDLENIAFERYGVYDPEIIRKARKTQAMQEMYQKLWRLRRKYAKLIVDEIVTDGAKGIA